MINGLSPASLLARCAAFARALAQRSIIPPPPPPPPPRLLPSSNPLNPPFSPGSRRRTPSSGPPPLSPNGRAAPPESSSSESFLCESSKAPPPDRPQRPGPRRPETVHPVPSPAVRRRLTPAAPPRAPSPTLAIAQRGLIMTKIINGLLFPGLRFPIPRFPVPLVATLALLAILGALVLPATAQAQTATTLVSNLGQARR